MKKTLLALVVTSLLIAPIFVFAADPNPEGPRDDIDIIEALQSLINWAFYILTFVAVLFFIIAGFMFVTARGNDEQIKKARSMLTYAVIGLVVAALSWAAVRFIERILG